MTYDSARERVVLFGGSTNSMQALDDTWERVGTRWIERREAVRPPARENHALCYDSARRCVVLFGGMTSMFGTHLADTWIWDGDTWSLARPTASPAARSFHALAYDVGRQRSVLFGGQHVSGFLGDTWEWDGTNWIQRSMSTSPEPRIEHALAYDLQRQRTVLFGGYGAYGALFDTWEWEGMTWIQRQPAVRPASLGRHGMAYDLQRRHVVLFGGNGFEHWTWDGTAWTPEPPALRPAAVHFAMTYDLARQSVVLFGGEATNGTHWIRSADTWEWDGTSWTLQAESPSPSTSNSQLVYDRVRRRAVLFGGTQGDSVFPHDETWEWDGAGWTRRSPPLSPAARRLHAMVWDDARRRVVLFGGLGLAGDLADTWEWDGATWTQRVSATTPPARSGHAMAHDTVRQRTVLFGGVAWVADTWEWDGTDWTQRLPATSPPFLDNHVMAYDAARQRVVLFGGYGSGFPVGTWEWDGTNWAQRPAATMPVDRRHAAMTWDPVRQRIVLFGGDMPGSWPQVRADTWDWDGSTWLRLQPAASPPPRMGHAMAYDERSERLLLFGGQGVTAGDDTWSFGLPAGAAAQPAGLACHGSRGLPVLSGSLPHLGNTGLVVDLLEVPARSPCVFGFSPAMQARPIGSGCTLYLGDPIVPLFTVTSATGFASVRCAVPLDVRLRGEVLFAQAFALDAGAALGVVFSAARVMTLGD